MSVEVKVIGVDQLRKAINRNPNNVRKEFDKFLTRAFAIYKRAIGKNPWKIGGSGGGVPKLSGNLYQSHRTYRKPFYGRIEPSLQVASYAGYVHDGTKKMKARPWLTYVKEKEDTKIEKEADKMLEKITKDLTK